MPSVLVLFYSESKYSVESVFGKYLENGWSNQHGNFSVEFVIEKLTTLWPKYSLKTEFLLNAFLSGCILRLKPEKKKLHRVFGFTVVLNI